MVEASPCGEEWRFSRKDSWAGEKIPTGEEAWKGEATKMREIKRETAFCGSPSF